MSRSLLLITFAALLALSTAASAQPGPIDPNASSWWIVCPSGAMLVSNCPAGDFELVGNSCGGAGGASIQYHFFDINGNQVIGLPQTNVWLMPVNPAEVVYYKPNMPVTDIPSDLAGRTWTTIALSAGGCSQLGLQCVVLDPVTSTLVVLQNPPSIQITFKSPDINADGIVNLADLSFFAASYGAMPYNYCCDYNDDGVVNLSDLAFFGGHYMHQ
jgi:hypothetical protein